MISFQREIRKRAALNDLGMMTGSTWELYFKLESGGCISFSSVVRGEGGEIKMKIILGLK
jgi:hypothetical protein